MIGYVGAKPGLRHGSVYFVVTAAVGPNTERKRQMAERKTASSFTLAERP